MQMAFLMAGIPSVIHLELFWQFVSMKIHFQGDGSAHANRQGTHDYLFGLNRFLTRHSLISKGVVVGLFQLLCGT